MNLNAERIWVWVELEKHVEGHLSEHGRLSVKTGSSAGCVQHGDCVDGCWRAAAGLKLN